MLLCMEHDKLVSLLVTYYNQKEYVSKSLESLLMQEGLSSYEILVGDDGSDDGTIELVREYQQRHPDIIRLYVMPREQGVAYDAPCRASANRLHLLSKAKGKYFLVLDGDDYYCNPLFVRRAIDVLEENPALSCCAFGMDMLQDGELIHYKPSFSAGEFSSMDFLSSGGYLHAAAFVFRSPTPEQIRLLCQHGRFDDMCITAFFLARADAFYIPEPALVYRVLRDSIWHSYSEAEQLVLMTLTWKYYVFLDPRVKGAVLAGRAYPFSYVWKMRRRWNEVLTEDQHVRLVKKAMDRGEYYVASLLRWNELSFFGKLKVHIWHLIYLYYIIKSLLQRKLNSLLLKRSKGSSL